MLLVITSRIPYPSSSPSDRQEQYPAARNIPGCDQYPYLYPRQAESDMSVVGLNQDWLIFKSLNSLVVFVIAISTGNLSILEAPKKP